MSSNPKKFGIIWPKSSLPQLHSNDDSMTSQMNEQLAGLILFTTAADEVDQQARLLPTTNEDTIDDSTIPEPTNRNSSWEFKIFESSSKSKLSPVQYPIRELVEITSQIAKEVRVNCELLADGFDAGLGISGEFEDKMVEMMGLFLEANSISVNLMLALIAMIQAKRKENAVESEGNKENEETGETEEDDENKDSFADQTRT
jgi:hypothetical protein